jgi:hypothetical protein
VHQFLSRFDAGHHFPFRLRDLYNSERFMA